VANENYLDPRLAAVYDALDPDRSDLLAYLALAHEFGARSVLDIGSGTGVFALMLADAGFRVAGVEPAPASLAVARAKPGAERVHWVTGDARALPPLAADLATMTGNVAQAIETDEDWNATLLGAHDALVPGGHLVFETRIPAARAWEAWHGERSTTDVAGVGPVTEIYEITEVALPFVRFRCTNTFEADGTVIVSDSTLRFRERDEVCDDLARHHFHVVDIRDAPDRPGREWVFVARRDG
jgi:SAM-dependent methyltransferase